MPFDAANYAPAKIGKPVTQDNELQRILREARGLVEANWTKGRMIRDLPFPGGYAYCMVGAVQKTVTGNAVRKSQVTRNKRVDRAIRQLDLALGSWGSHSKDEEEQRSAVIRFNDSPYVGLRNVLEVFDKAIESAGAR